MSIQDRASTPLRHCMVVYARYPLGETRVQREAEALVEAGFEVDVLCLRGEGEPARERYRGVEIRRVPMTHDKRSLPRQMLSYLRFGLKVAGFLGKAQELRPYDAVQVHNLPDFLVFSAIVPKTRGVPVLLDLHDLMPEFFAARFPGEGSLLAQAIAAQERLACRFADHVITVSEHWRQTLIDRGVPPERCSVVMNVADERIFAPPPGERAPHEGFELIYHGTLTHRYGLDLAIEAVGMLRDELPGLRLTVIGRGDALEDLTAQRDRLGLRDLVDLRTELVLAEDLPPLLARADAGVVPYRDDVFTDGLLPTKLMEYAVMGMPCIAARTTAIESVFGGSMVEFFTPGDAADLARAIRLLATDPARCAELAEGTRTFTARHRWSEVGPRYVALVEGLVASSRAGRR